MVTKNKIFSDGDVLNASDLNNNILQPLSNLDNTDANITYHNNTTYTSYKTYTIDANVISNYIIIKATIRARANNAYLKIYIDGVATSFEQSVNSTDSTDYSYRTLTFKYEPTSSQKTNGFSIDYYFKVSSAGSGNNAGMGGYEVWGA